MSKIIDYSEVIEDRMYPYKKTESDLRFVIILTAVFVAVVFIFTHLFIGVQVYGQSMYPTLNHGDRLYLNTMVEPKHGDIIVFHHEDKEYIKRVIGMVGDTVYSKDGIVYRREKGETEFTEIDESYLGESWESADQVRLQTVPEGKLFVLGDNRRNSSDSRAFGCVSSDDIVGVVTPWSLHHKEFLTDFFGFFQKSESDY